MSERYVLRGHEAVPEPDLLRWAEWFETADRHVDVTEIGDAKVSTVFLGLNHSFGDEPPTLFETMIFGGSHDGHQARCATWDEAVQMHEAGCAIAKAEGNPA